MTFSSCQWLTTQLTGYVITWQNLQVLDTYFLVTILLEGLLRPHKNDKIRY